VLYACEDGLTRIGFEMRTMPSRSSFSFDRSGDVQQPVPGPKPYFSAMSFWIRGRHDVLDETNRCFPCADRLVVTEDDLVSLNDGILISTRFQRTSFLHRLTKKALSRARFSFLVASDSFRAYT